ncbi:MAG: ABC transporter substrate-binding protein, partial [Rickettsiales bacterium]
MAGIPAYAQEENATASSEESFGPQHALTMYGEPKYGPDFGHFDYANPDAPKGGRINLDHWQVFDTLQPFLFKGIKAPGMGGNGGKPALQMRYFQPLMIRSGDEPFTYYGMVAKTVEVAKDRSWAEFTLRPEARFHDNSPITADDVVFTYNILLEKGDPIYKVQFALFDRVEKIDDHTVRF